METIKLNINHINDVVRLHELAFNGFFLTELGSSFLNLYYKSVIKSKTSICLGAFNEDKELIGFAITAKISRGFNKSLILKNSIPFTMLGFKLLLTRPKAIYRLLKNLDKTNDAVKDDLGNYSELLSIATNPNHQGLGVGKMLICETEKRLFFDGSKKLALTTDFFNNDIALRFYKKNGYKIYYDFITYPNRKMYKLIKTL